MSIVYVSAQYVCLRLYHAIKSSPTAIYIQKHNVVQLRKDAAHCVVQNSTSGFAVDKRVKTATQSSCTLSSSQCQSPHVPTGADKAHQRPSNISNIREDTAALQATEQQDDSRQCKKCSRAAL